MADLRVDVLLNWAPPGGGFSGALNHVVIHGLDVLVPLGLERRPPDATMRVVLDDLTAGGIHARFGTDIAERKLEASDLDWWHGSGPALSGTAQHLALAVSGRTLPPGYLEGDPL